MTFKVEVNDDMVGYAEEAVIVGKDMIGEGMIVHDVEVMETDDYGDIHHHSFSYLDLAAEAARFDE